MGEKLTHHSLLEGTEVLTPVPCAKSWPEASPATS